MTMCGFETLIACFSLSGFYLDAELIHRDEGRGELLTIVTQKQSGKHEKILYAPITTYTIDRKAADYYSVAAIGYSVSMGKFTARIEGSREFTDGINAASIGVTWRPFAK
jgi:hypothetical protein